MQPTYSDIYALLTGDPKSEAYFNSLPGYIQDQIRNKKHQPGSYEAWCAWCARAKRYSDLPLADCPVRQSRAGQSPFYT